MTIKKNQYELPNAGDVGAEPAFSKNTAFNKDFGTSAGTVLEGDTVIPPAAPVDSVNGDTGVVSVDMQSAYAAGELINPNVTQGGILVGVNGGVDLTGVGTGAALAAIIQDTGDADNAALFAAQDGTLTNVVQGVTADFSPTVKPEVGIIAQFFNVATKAGGSVTTAIGAFQHFSGATMAPTAQAILVGDNQDAATDIPALVGKQAGNAPAIQAVSSGDSADLRFTQKASDPATNLVDGDVWYNAADDRYRARANGATVTFATTGDLGAIDAGAVITPAVLTANTDDWNPTGLATARLIRVSSTADRDLNGITAPSPARAQVIHLHNVGNNKVKIMKQQGSSLAANRFAIKPASLDLEVDECAILIYDVTSARWRVSAANI